MGVGLLMAITGMLWFTQIGVPLGLLDAPVPGRGGDGLRDGHGVRAGQQHRPRRGVARANAGVASALINSTQQVGGSIGTALLNTIATTVDRHVPAGSRRVERGGGCRRWRHGRDGGGRDRPRLRGGVRGGRGHPRAGPDRGGDVHRCPGGIGWNHQPGRGAGDRRRRRVVAPGCCGPRGRQMCPGPYPPAAQGAGLLWRPGRPAWPAGERAGIVAARCHTGDVLATDLHDEIERSADPAGVTLALERVVRAHPDAADRIDADPAAASALIAVVAASPWLARVCATDPAALDVLADLDQPSGAGGRPMPARAPGRRRLDAGTATGRRDRSAGLARAKRLEMLRIAARDLLGLDDVEAGRRPAVPAGLRSPAAGLGPRPTERHPAWRASDPDAGGLAVIGLGKLGGGELNYSSDVDLLLVAPTAPPGRRRSDPRAFLDLARQRLAGRPRPATRRPGRPADPHPALLPGLLGPLGRDLGVPGPAQGPGGRRQPAARGQLRAGSRQPGCGAAPSAPTSCARSAGSKPEPSRP